MTWFALFIPLLAAFIIMVTSFKIKRTITNIIGCGSILISFILFCYLLFTYSHQQPEVVTLFNWIPIQQIKADFSLRIDPLSLQMALIITGVGFLIHVFATGYMEHDEDFARFFACMNFFVFSMLLLVLAANLLLLYVGWEGVGLASYLLIGFWYTRVAAAKAATKAFVVNRVGDLGLTLGIILTFYLFGTSDMGEIFSQTERFQTGSTIIIVLTLLYFVGAVGKSAQIPLHVWLPDAMEGPTPVSALIHAATMVTAGVYLVVRMHPVFMLAPQTLYLIGAIGGITSLFAALSAIGQNDLKRVLAYSTVSQLGLMFLACGIGAFYAAMFHLTTHAFIKALLFLTAGNVIHMMHGTTDMNNMGGLAKKFPVTHWLFLIGVLGLSGVPPLAAFFSKDLILEEEHLAGFETFFYVGLITSILTAFYLTRAYCLTFLGKFNIEQKVLKMVYEAPKVMLIPVSILAVLSIIGGFLGFAYGRMPWMEGFLAEIGITMPNTEIDGKFIFTFETLLSVIGGFAGIAVAVIMYTTYKEKYSRSLPLFTQAFYFNELYHRVIVMPLRYLAKIISRFLEPKVFDEMIQGLSTVSQNTAKSLQSMQSGQMRSYVAWMAIGTVILLIIFAL